MKRMLLYILGMILLCVLVACSKQSAFSESDSVQNGTVGVSSIPSIENMVAHGIPIVKVYTKDNAEIFSREEYVQCTVNVSNCEEAYVMDAVPGGIRVRGNASAYLGDVEKIRQNSVPYRIKFDGKQSMLGLNDGAECKSWVLIKTLSSLIRDDIAFRMGRAIMDGHGYCTDSTFVHLYVNDKFVGVYLLCEQSQVNEYRVDINEPEKDYGGTDVGYFLEIDNYASSEPNGVYFKLDYEEVTITDITGVTRSIIPAAYSIKSDVYSSVQAEFISRYMSNLWMVLYEACEKDNYLSLNKDGTISESSFVSSYEVADSLLDLESVVNMYILYELVHDYDCGRGSFYMCIDFSPDSQCEKLQFTCPWDFSWTYYEEAIGQYYAATFCSEKVMETYGDRGNPWFILLMKQAWFRDMVCEKWTLMHANDVLQDCLLAEEDYLRTNAGDLNIVESSGTKNAQKILSWIRNRIEWLDSQWLEGQDSALS